MIYDSVITNGIILTVNADFDIIRNGYIAIQDGKIAEIGSDKAPPRAQNYIDAMGGVIMPGLINTHTHLPMTIFRGLADDLPLQTWLEDHIFPAEADFITPESAYWGALLGCAEMLLSGTTTCCDGYFFEDSVAEAIDAIGMRGVVGQGVIDFPAPGVPDPSSNIRTAETFVDRWLGRSSRIKPSIFCHSPYTCSGKTLQSAKAAAELRRILFQIHVSETRDERKQIDHEHGVGPIKYLSNLKLLTPMTLLVHAVWVDEDDIGLIREANAPISHNPQSNMKLASGIAPVHRFLREGITVGIGTDGCASNNRLDLFREIDVAAKLHKVATMDPTALSARTALTVATFLGAKAIGWENEIGSLKVGKSADIIVIDTKQPHLTPLFSPESHLVYAARGSDVRHVFVDGRLVVKEGSLTTIDVTNVIKKVADLSKQIKNRQP